MENNSKLYSEGKGKKKNLLPSKEKSSLFIKRDEEEGDTFV